MNKNKLLALFIMLFTANIVQASDNSFHLNPVTENESSNKKQETDSE